MGVEILESPKDGKSTVLSIYQSSWLLHQRSIHAIYFMIESARVAQIMSSTIASPQGSRDRSTIDALPALCEQVGVKAHHCNGQPQFVLGRTVIVVVGG